MRRISRPMPGCAAFAAPPCSRLPLLNYRQLARRDHGSIHGKIFQPKTKSPCRSSNSTVHGDEAQEVSVNSPLGAIAIACRRPSDQRQGQTKESVPVVRDTVGDSTATAGPGGTPPGRHHAERLRTNSICEKRRRQRHGGCKKRNASYLPQSGRKGARVEWKSGSPKPGLPTFPQQLSSYDSILKTEFTKEAWRRSFASPPGSSFA